MKKLFSLMLLTLFVASPLFAADEDDQATQVKCFNSVARLLKTAPKFSSLLPVIGKDIPLISNTRSLTVSCEDRSVRSGFDTRVNADVSLTIIPLVNGNPLGGTVEAVHVEGFKSGSGPEGDRLEPFDVSSLTYQKTDLR
ncbi:MAG: hypothetical protein HYY62_07855 [Deltaproteobacteria bacterium]|nr:hypothetical protein [Deltaproteobacteria bacterium]